MSIANENGANTLATAVITGASTGIGAVYADRLAQRGYDLILVARDSARLQTLAEKLRAQNGVRVEVLRADLTDKDDLYIVEQRLRHDRDISLLVNNAGIAVMSGLIDANPDQLEAMVSLNVVAPTRLAVAAVSNFVKQTRGALINISSVLALAPELFNGSYSGTKAYLLNFTQALHGEVAAHGVQVQAVLPGATRTEIWERAGGSVDSMPPEMVMDVDELVDAALVGFDRGELITIPSLPNAAEWEQFNAARLQLQPNLSRNHAASRYGVN